MAKKQKIKIVYRNPAVLKEDEGNKLKAEISELEQKRAQLIGKGFKGFIQRLSINKRIGEKQMYFSAKDKLKSIKAKTEYMGAMLEHEKVKNELKELKQKNQVNFNDIFKTNIYN